MTIVIEILETADCAHAELTERLVRQLATDLNVGVEVRHSIVRSAQQALEQRFAGTPTVLVDGYDLELDVEPTVVLACRRYQGGKSVPPRWLVEAALLRAAQPRSILFLCHANSVRSQMAEALARQLLPPAVQVQSAGSVSSYVHALARQVLDEIGLDTSELRSKSVAEIDAAPIEAVITLCDEQTCPVFLGHARRVHWPIRDPSSAFEAKSALEAFRACRDEIAQRIRQLVPRQKVRG